MHKIIFLSFVWIFLLSSTQAAWSIEDQVRVTMVRGKITASDGKVVRTLKRYDLVSVGEIIKTGSKGLGQLVFPDQTMLYLKASSELKIEAFHFDLKEPKKDKTVIKILKGGMRILSGIVAKRNPDKVKYNTYVSTIGIRGTAVDINQGGVDCLSKVNNANCRNSDEWSVTFDFGHGWVETEGGRVEVAEGQTVSFTRRSKPSFARFKRHQGDPAFLARQFSQMESNQIEAWAKEQGSRLRQEDLFLALGMFKQANRFSLDKLQGAVKGFSQTMSREERSDMREFSSRIYPGEGHKIMKSSTLNKDEVSASLESILRGMSDASQNDLKQVYEAAVEMGITLEQAEQVMENIKNNPMLCR